MKGRLLFTLLALLLTMATVNVYGKGDKFPHYDIESAGSGVEGTCLVKVWVITKNGNVADEDFKRAAVHGVVFRGFTGNASGARQPAMAPATAEQDNAEFCKAFFSADGPCQGYATVITGSYGRVKTQKEYKCSAVVQVDKSRLRKELEKAGVVRSLSSGF